MKKEISITKNVLTQTMFVSMSMFIISMIITLWGNM